MVELIKCLYNNTLSQNKLDLKIKDTQQTTRIERSPDYVDCAHVVKNNILSNTTGDHLFDASNCDTKEPR